jgi:hypothetical protein
MKHLQRASDAQYGFKGVCSKPGREEIANRTRPQITIKPFEGVTLRLMQKWTARTKLACERGVSKGCSMIFEEICMSVPQWKAGSQYDVKVGTGVAPTDLLPHGVVVDYTRCHEPKSENRGQPSITI